MHAAVPRYLRVFGSLEAQMEAGDSKVRDYLPAEPESQKLFNVSRTTVRRAMELLAQEGFVSIRQGKGTEVLDFRAAQRLQHVTLFSETLREKGFTVRWRNAAADFVAAPRG